MLCADSAHKYALLLFKNIPALKKYSICFCKTAFVLIFSLKLVKIRNCLNIFHNFKKTMTINGKNYQNARHRSYSYYGNGEGWQRNKYTIAFDAWT